MTIEVQGQLATTNGTTLYYERAGAGETLVLVHGGGGDRRHWDEQFGELARDFDVLRYDLRGFGKSSNPIEEAPYRHEDDLHELMVLLGISRGHFAGFSLGSQIVVDAYTLYPELFKSIVAVGPYVSGYSSPASEHLFSAFGRCGKTFQKSGAQGAAQDFVNIPAFNPQHIHAGVKERVMQIAGEYSWWWATHRDPMVSVTPVATSKLDAIDVPVLTVTAEYDATVCREVADLMQQRIASHVGMDVAGASHFMLLEKPVEVNTGIRKFLRKLGA